MLKEKLLLKSIFYLVVFVLITTILQINEYLFEFNRNQILSGQLWRIVTAHFVHLDLKHFAFNFIAFLLIIRIFINKINFNKLILLIFSNALIISILMLIFYPNISWYNGFSAILHALILYFCAISFKENIVFKFIIILLCIKVYLENTDIFTLSNVVLVEAHLLGLVSGLLSIVYYLYVKQYGKNFKV